MASGAGTLGSIPPFGDQQARWASAALSARLGCQRQTADLGDAEREAMEGESSLIYVRTASQLASAQAPRNPA